MAGANNTVPARHRLRVLKFVAEGAATVTRAAGEGKVLLECGARGAIAVGEDVLRVLGRDGLICRNGERLALTASGVAAWKRAGAADDDGFLAQHRDLEDIRIEIADGYATATANLSESPLGQLFRRKGKDGRPFLSEKEFRAGERLRADYDRGRIMPRLGANWQAAVASGRRDGGAGGIADLTDAALAARQRVDRAIGAVGPELAGVLIDVCCFLKGIETVEAERGWPVRSAKIVLKTALGVLARHYEPPPKPASILHWGTEGYRPRVGE